MNYLSQEKDTLSDFRNLLQSRNYQETRSLLESKQEAFQSLSKTFVLSVRFLACDVKDAVVPGQSNPEMFLLLCSLTA